MKPFEYSLSFKILFKRRKIDGWKLYENGDTMSEIAYWTHSLQIENSMTSFAISISNQLYV